MALKTKELSVFERGEIIGTWKCGVTKRKISEALNLPQNTIHDIISAYKIIMKVKLLFLELSAP
jgi:hypothetical protein